jgi:hypothetical protein
MWNDGVVGRFLLAVDGSVLLRGKARICFYPENIFFSDYCGAESQYYFDLYISA